MIATGLVLTPLIIAIGQILFKLASERLVESGKGLYMVLFDPIMILALALYGGATIVWIYLLKSVPLSYAYSFMAVSYTHLTLPTIYSV